MSLPAMLLVQACAPVHVIEGVCTQQVWLPYPQPVLPPLTTAEGWAISIGITLMWAAAVKGRLLFRAARMGNF